MKIPFNGFHGEHAQEWPRLRDPSIDYSELKLITAAPHPPGDWARRMLPTGRRGPAAFNGTCGGRGMIPWIRGVLPSFVAAAYAATASAWRSLSMPISCGSGSSSSSSNSSEVTSSKELDLCLRGRLAIALVSSKMMSSAAASGGGSAGGGGPLGTGDPGAFSGGVTCLGGGGLGVIGGVGLAGAVEELDAAPGVLPLEDAAENQLALFMFMNDRPLDEVLGVPSVVLRESDLPPKLDLSVPSEVLRSSDLPTIDLSEAASADFPKSTLRKLDLSRSSPCSSDRSFASSFW